MGDPAPIRAVDDRRCPSSWVDRRALDRRGELLGVVVDVYDDATSQRPAWLAISTGFFGTRVAVAPLHGARLLGDDIVVAHDATTIRSAPAVQAVVAIHPAGERSLVTHYGPSASDGPISQPESSP